MNVRSGKGFTLIEVVVALAIIGWVMASTVFLVKQYADQRLLMRERFIAGQVAWNSLMDEYRASRGLLSPNEVGLRQESGETRAGQRQWLWELEVTPALGESLYRYRVEVSTGEAERSSASRSLYLVVEDAEP